MCIHNSTAAFKLQLRDCARSMLWLFLFPLGSELAKTGLPLGGRSNDCWPYWRNDTDCTQLWYFKSETKKMKQKTKLLCCLYMCQQAGDFNPQRRASACFFVCITTRWRCSNIGKKGTTSFSSSNVDFWIQCPTNKCVLLFCFVFCSERHNEQIWLVHPSWLVKEEETLTRS